MGTAQEETATPGPGLAAAAEVRAVLDGDALQIVVQPIVCLATGRILGVEALSRFSAPGGRTPEDWFADAAAVGLGIELELRAASRALRTAAALSEPSYVSINLSPEALLAPATTALLTSGEHLRPSRILVELTERTPVDDYDRLRQALKPLRAAGVRLAVDDAGAGYANFRHILNLDPQVIKIDRSLIQGIEADPARRALLAAVVTFAHGLGAAVVAEGLERVEELTTCVNLGIDAGQGYLFGRPAPVPAGGLTATVELPGAPEPDNPSPVPSPVGPGGRSGASSPRSAVAAADRLAAVRSYRLPGHAGDPDLDGVVALMARVARVPMAVVNLVGTDLQCYPAEHGVGVPSTDIPDELSFCAHVVAGRVPLTVADARTHPVFSRNPMVERGEVGAYLGVPLIDEDGYALGALSVFDARPRIFTADDRAVLETLAGLVRAVLSLRRRLAAQQWDAGMLTAQNLVLEEITTGRPLPGILDHLSAAAGNLIPAPDAGRERGLDDMVTRLTSLATSTDEWRQTISRMALEDPLTGLANRAHFSQAAEDALDGGGALLLIDLNRFKEVNDRGGHALGDQLLVDLAHRLRAVVTETVPGSVVGRLGGDEFAAALPAVDRATALALREHLLTELVSHVLAGGTTVTVSASVGLAMAPRGASLDEVVAAADHAMYAAKRARRRSGEVR
jgi:diguanylate cyclase (GGDEF)-like protein